MDGAVQIGRWVLRPDVGRTRDAHARLITSGAAECGCDPCANFEAARPKLLESPLGIVLAQLGIAPPWEVEVYSLSRAASGLHLYGGWFHFVGAIESGPEKASVGTPNFDPLSPTIKIEFHTEASLIRPPFEGLPLVQLEIIAEVPWVIGAVEPE